MPFFKSKPNIPDRDKARVEFQLQQLAERVGPAPFRNHVVIPTQVFGQNWKDASVDSIKELVARQLEYDVDPIKIQIVPQKLEKCGGGG